MMRFLVGLLLVSLAMGAHAGEVIKRTLIGPAEGPSAENISLTSKKAAPGSPTLWEVHKRRLHGGKQEGVDVVEVSNGALNIAVVPTRGMGIYKVQSAKQVLGWDSPVKEIVHPKLVNLAARGGLGWLEGFNEWLCRCGLENVGQPGPDTIVTNTGDKATIDLPLHGKIANTPAEFVEVEVQKKAPHRITLRGFVRESMLFGPNLVLQTEISTLPGSPSFTIRDVVHNVGGSKQEFQLLYHFNFGAPLLDKTTRFLAPLEGVKPFNERAAKDAKEWDTFRGPTPGYVEQVYLLRPLADDKDMTTLLLYRPDLQIGCSMTYSVKQLPHLTLWKNTGAREDGYVIGIEPGTSYPNRRQVEREAGRVPKLAAGEKHEATLEIQLHPNVKELERVAERIRRIQGKREVKLELGKSGGMSER